MIVEPRWKVYLWVEAGNVARCTYWDTVEYKSKLRAINIARKSANALYKKYRTLPNIGKPVEEHKSSGAVIFRIPGMTEDRWPKVEPIEDS